MHTLLHFHDCSALTGLRFLVRLQPRALPWADVFGPFRAAILLIVCLLPLSSARATDPDDDAPVSESADTPTPIEKPSAESSLDKPADTNPDKADGKTVTITGDKEGDVELIESLDDDSRDFVEQALESLQRAFDGMQTARRRIAADDTGAETVKTQERVVHELEDLLKLVKKQQNRNQQKSQQNQDKNQDQQSSSRQKMPKGQNDPQNSQPGSKSNQDQGGKERRSDGKSADSEERSDAARQLAEEQARRQQVIKDVWGHLPPHVRDAMLTSLSEKYLPKYEDLVKKYYEDLAEKSRKHGGK